jgi:hypothetical protein
VLLGADLRYRAGTNLVSPSLPVPTGASTRSRNPQYKILVQRMRAELAHVRADDILHVSHSIARPGVPGPSRSYTVMVIYRER